MSENEIALLVICASAVSASMSIATIATCIRIDVKARAHEKEIREMAANIDKNRSVVEEDGKFYLRSIEGAFLLKWQGLDRCLNGPDERVEFASRTDAEDWLNKKKAKPTASPIL